MAPTAENNLASVTALRRPRDLPVLSDCIVGQRNNLNLIRMVAAVSVLVSHAYPLCLGATAEEPLESSLRHTLGTIAVFVFFAISGHLIAWSWEKSPGLGDFWMRRMGRILPGLLVALLVTILVGAIATDAPMLQYGRAASSYLLHNLTLYQLQPELPGIFVDNPFGPTINGSIWTLSYEVICYGGVVALGYLGAFRRTERAVLAIAAFLCFYVALQMVPSHLRLKHLADFGLPFVAGVASYVWRRSFILSWWLGIVLVGVTALAYYSMFFTVLFTLTLGYVVFLLAFRIKGPVLRYNDLGDYSYGIYSYAFPVQQTLAAYGVTEPLYNMALALPIVLVAAVASWCWVEKPALVLLRSRSAPQRVHA